MREKVRRLVETSGFQWTIIAVILVNAVIIGLETSPSWTDRYGDETTVVGWVTVGIFVVEIGLRLFAYGLSFFRGPWNLFDLSLIHI